MCDNCEELSSRLHALEPRCAFFRERCAEQQEEIERLNERLCVLEQVQSKYEELQKQYKQLKKDCEEVIAKKVMNQKKENARLLVLLKESRDEAINAAHEIRDLKTALHVSQEKLKAAYRANHISEEKNKAYESYIDNVAQGKMLCIVKNEQDAKDLLKLRK